MVLLPEVRQPNEGWLWVSEVGVELSLCATPVKVLLVGVALPQANLPEECRRCCSELPWGLEISIVMISSKHRVKFVRIHKPPATNLARKDGSAASKAWTAQLASLAGPALP